MTYIGIVTFPIISVSTLKYLNLHIDFQLLSHSIEKSKMKKHCHKHFVNKTL